LRRPASAASAHAGVSRSSTAVWQLWRFELEGARGCRRFDLAFESLRLGLIVPPVSPGLSALASSRQNEFCTRLQCCGRRTPSDLETGPFRPSAVTLVASKLGIQRAAPCCPFVAVRSASGPAGIAPLATTKVTRSPPRSEASSLMNRERLASFTARARRFTWRSL